MKPHYKIGFMYKPFPVVEESITDTKIYKMRCLNFDVDVEVSQCKLDSSGLYFSGIITSRVDIANKLYMHGFGSNCHIDEINTMFAAVMLYCNEYNLQLVGQYNNWPSFRGSVNKLKVLVDNPDQNGLFRDERDLI